MFWSCQTLSTRNDALDQYPILCLHAQNPHSGCEGQKLKVDPAQYFFRLKFRLKTDKFKSVVATNLLEGSYTRIFNIAVRIPVSWHSRGYPILPDFRNCLFLVQCSAEFWIWTMQRWILNCPYLPIFGNSFVQIFSAIWSDHSLCSFVESSFAVSLMTTWCPCRWSW